MPSSDDHKSRPSNVNIGREYEERAARFYLDNDFTILERNWRAGRREIDLIVRKGNVIAFVEVKASRSSTFGHPAERVDSRKQQFLTDAATEYLAEKNVAGVDVRFDVVTFYEGQLEHYPNAFDEPQS